MANENFVIFAKKWAGGNGNLIINFAWPKEPTELPYSPQNKVGKLRSYCIKFICGVTNHHESLKHLYGEITMEVYAFRKFAQL